MADSGSNNTTAPTETSRPNGGNSPVVTVILVVVLSILVLCVSGIGLVIHHRRRMKGKRYILLQTSQDSSNATVIDNASTSNPHTDDFWNRLWRRINLLSAPSPPNPYSPVQLPTSRNPSKVDVRFLDPNIHRTPPSLTNNTPSPAPGRPTPRPTPGSYATPTLPTVLLHPPTPQSPMRHHTEPIPRVKQSINRIAPWPDSSMPLPRPVRLPSGPLNLPNSQPSTPSRSPIEVIMIDRPRNFQIDGSPVPSLRPGNHGEGEIGRPPRHGRSYSDGNLVVDRSRLSHSVTSPTGTFQSQDSDSVRDQRFPRQNRRRESFGQPMSPQDNISPTSDGSVSTTDSVAGSSRPPTLSFKTLLFSLNPARTVPPVPALATPNPQLRRPIKQTAQGPAPDRSPPYHRTQFIEPYQHNQRALYTSQQKPQYSRDQSRQHPSHTRQQSWETEIQQSPEPLRRALPTSKTGNVEGLSRHGDQPHEHEPKRTNAPRNPSRDDGLFPGSVVGAGYQTRRVPKPLQQQSSTTETTQFPSTIAPPPVPSSWAPLRSNRL